MKIINTRVMAQSMIGTNANTAALVSDPSAGAGWNIFAFSGKLPTSKEGFAAAFDQRSLADMYNKSIGIVRNPITGVENGNVIAMALQSQYIPKGVSYYGTIGTAAIVVSQLVPHRIIRSGATDRNITPLMGSGNIGAPLARSPQMNIDFEFDNPVTIKYLKYNATPNNSFILVAVNDNGDEIQLGATSALTGDANCRVLAAPVASKKYRYKYNASGGPHVPHVFLSDVDVPSSVAVTSPTWAVLAHCNTLTHGDINYSDEIMFTAGAVGNQGPFRIVGDVVPNKKTMMYCPKLRFSQRSS